MIDIHHRYYDTVPESSRVPATVVANMDNIIAQTSLAHILECPARAENMGFEYAVNAYHDGSWSVSSTATSVTLNMSLDSTPESAVTTYLHEMIHVCQHASKDGEIHRQEQKNATTLSGEGEILEQARDLSLRRAAFRQKDAIRGLLNEVEAFFGMSVAYRELVTASPKVCGVAYEEPPWHNIWADSERQLASGTFAQASLVAYFEQERYAEHLDVIVDTTLPAVPYLYSSNGHTFDFHPFTPDFKAELNQRWLAVNDRREDHRPHQLPFEMQHILKEAGCYSGVLDNQWGPGSRAALIRYADANGLRLTTDTPDFDTYRSLLGVLERGENKCS